MTRTSNRVLEHEVFKGRTELLFMDPAVVACMMHQCDGEEGRVNYIDRGTERGLATCIYLHGCRRRRPNPNELVDLG